MGSVKRGLELDDRQEMAHLVLGVLLAISGEPRDGSVSVNHALALNPSNVQCHYATCMVNLFDPAMDGEVMRSSGEECLKLNPKDPRATMYHFFSALGPWVKHGLVPDDAYIAEMEAACRYKNAP